MMPNFASFNDFRTFLTSLVHICILYVKKKKVALCKI